MVSLASPLGRVSYWLSYGAVMETQMADVGPRTGFFYLIFLHYFLLSFFIGHFITDVSLESRDGPPPVARALIKSLASTADIES